MDGALQDAVCELIRKVTGEPTRIVGSQPAAGGCINRAEVARLADGRTYFVKSNPAPLPAMFEREAEGLTALAATGTIRVPGPLGAGDARSGGIPFLVTEAIVTGPPRDDFSEIFGRRFAHLHQAAAATEGFGFEHDNFIGATPQPNPWTPDWCDFWRHHRLGHQLDLARRAGLSDRTLDRLGDRLLDRLDELLGEPDEPPCLLHGDLWGGNYMVDQDGEPVLIDPAAYYGRREADLAMTQLFGGFDERFYAAYEEIWPLAPGSSDRLQVYQLYHLLNHLNLFGGGYRESCLVILRRFVGS